MTTKYKLRDYQNYFLNEIDKHDIIVAEWGIWSGLDFTISEYMKLNPNLTFGYIGLGMLYNQYEAKNIEHFNYKKFEGRYVDVLIYEVQGAKLYKRTLEYCVSHNIKIILKKNL